MAWLMIDPGAGSADVAALLAGQPGFVAPPSSSFPALALRGDDAALAALADRLRAQGARVAVVDDAGLAAARRGRRAATAMRREAAGLVAATDHGKVAVAPDDVAAAFVIDDDGDRHLCLALRSQPIVVAFSQGTLDASSVGAAGLAPAEAFGRLVDGFARMLGRPVDASLRATAAPAARALGLHALDVVDLGTGFWRGDLPAPQVASPGVAPPAALMALDARARDWGDDVGPSLELGGDAPRAQRSAGPQGRVAAEVGLPIDDDSVPLRKKCQSCDDSVDARDCYVLFSQPICDGCADSYLTGFGERLGKLAAVFAGALAVFAVLVLFLGPIGRILGGLLVVFVFHVVRTTGVQYDVDVERQKGKALQVVRRGGLFKRWDQANATWWGRWIMHRGLYAMLGVVAWFVPIGASATSSRDDDTALVAADERAAPSHVLKVLGAGATKEGLRVSLVEVRGTGEGASFVLQTTRGEQRAEKSYGLGELYDGVEAFGVAFHAIDAQAPPAVPSLTIVFDADD